MKLTLWQAEIILLPRNNGFMVSIVPSTGHSMRVMTSLASYRTFSSRAALSSAAR